jgi:protein-S-isoprenylcysteine O-methyltransferase Ste14
VGFAVALALGFAAPILALAGALDPIDALDSPAGNAVGIALAFGGLALTLYSQVAMGDAWRIGVDPDDRTTLVTNGPFAVVRNPIFSAIISTALGLTLMVRIRSSRGDRSPSGSPA